MRNHYDVLGVAQSAELEEIKTAYRKLVKNYHPDRQPGDEWARRRFLEVTEAYETLSDSELRAAHDASLFNWRPTRSTPEERRGGAGTGIAMAVVLVAVALGLGVGAIIMTSGDLRFEVSTAQQPASSKAPPTDQPAADETTAGPLVPAAAQPPAATAEDAPAAAADVPAKTESPIAPTVIARVGSTTDAPPDLRAPPAPALPPSVSVDAAPTPAAAPPPVETTDAAALLARLSPDADPSQAAAARLELRAVIQATSDKAELQRLAAGSDPQIALLAQARSAALAAAESRRLDDEAWAAAERDGAAAAIDTYLEKFPRGANAEAARSRLRRLNLIEFSVGPKEQAKNRWFKPGAGRSETFRDCDDCPAMVVVPQQASRPDGSVGAPSDSRSSRSEPTRPIGQPFAVSKHQITHKDWAVCRAEGACVDPGPGGRPVRSSDPVVNVSWTDANDYLKWLRMKSGHSYRLLRGGEWEHIAGAVGTSSERDQTGQTVGNAWGVAFGDPGLLEWVSDCWTGDVPRGAGPAEAGGACAERSLLGSVIISGAERGSVVGRFGDHSRSRDRTYTFRVARTL